MFNPLIRCSSHEKRRTRCCVRALHLRGLDVDYRRRRLRIYDFDEAGTIGKRYRRQDEIGTPLCITYDFDSEVDNCVTVRDRDTMEQVRIPIAELKDYIEKAITF